VKSKRRIWAGHAAHAGSREMHVHGFRRGNLKERDNLEDLIIDVRIILKRILKG
jgi:hypothetical protein